MTRIALVVLGCAVLNACGSAPAQTGISIAPPRELAEARALQIISDELTHLSVPNSRDWDIDVNAARALRVDVHVDGSDFGIEYVTAQDRSDMGDIIPDPDPDGQLRIMRGSRADGHAQVLVLDSQSYLYDEHIENVQEGALGMRDAEGRLTRDVEDFIAYARGQGLN
ncbi:MAG: hypothetical protein IPK60_01470 [Sandaracinaceae bacterium]|nr:hypothetical protein [Sandaracinaceae bacterium]